MRGIGANAKDIGALGIDRVDGAAKWAADQVPEHVAAHRTGALAGSDQGYAGGFENGVKGVTVRSQHIVRRTDIGNREFTNRAHRVHHLFHRDVYRKFYAAQRRDWVKTAMRVLFSSRVGQSEQVESAQWPGCGSRGATILRGQEAGQDGVELISAAAGSFFRQRNVWPRAGFAAAAPGHSPQPPQR